LRSRPRKQFLTSKAVCDGWAFREIMPQSEATPHEEVKDD